MQLEVKSYFWRTFEHRFYFSSAIPGSRVRRGAVTPPPPPRPELFGAKHRPQSELTMVSLPSVVSPKQYCNLMCAVCTMCVCVYGAIILLWPVAKSLHVFALYDFSSSSGAVNHAGMGNKLHSLPPTATSAPASPSITTR